MPGLEDLGRSAMAEASRFASTIKDFTSEAAAKAKDTVARAVESAAELKFEQAEDAGSAIAIFKKAQPDKTLASRRTDVKTGKRESVLVRQKFEGAANNFSGKNKQFTAQDLLDLIVDIETAKPKMDRKGVLDAVQAKYKDPALVSKALEFLANNITDENQRAAVKRLSNDYLSEKRNEIEASAPIVTAAAEAPRQKIGATTDELVDIHFKFKESGSFKEIFDDLTKKYSYKQIIGIADFLRTSVGAELRKNPLNNDSEDHAALTHMMNEVKMLRVLASLYRFASVSFPLIKKQCEQEGAMV